MATLEEIRAQYPQYADMSDVDLANSLHRKFYKDIPIGEFYQKAGVKFPKEYNAASDAGNVDNVRAGIGRGMSNVVRNIGNVVGLVSDQSMRDRQALDSDLMNTGAGQIGSFIGEAAAVTPLSLGVGAGLARAAGGRALANPTLLQKVAGNTIARGAIEGGAQGALTAGPDNRGTGAMFGGLAGGALPAVMGAGSKAVRGLSRTPEAQALLNEGVSLTPGQMNPKGWLNQAEEALQSAPVVGSVVRNARESAEDQFRRAVIQRGSPSPLPQTQTTQEAIDAAYKAFQPMYDQGKGFPVRAAIMNANAPDIPLSQAVGRAVQSPQVFADKATRSKVAGFVNNQLTALKSGASSDDLLSIRSNIRTAARDADGAERKLLRAAEKQVTAALKSQLPADAMNAVEAADAQYGIYKVAEKAVAKSRDRPGGFTPTMLSQAIKEATDTGEFARGGGKLRDLAQAGSAAFEMRSPPTGARLATIMGLGGASYLEPTVGLPLTAGLLGMTGTRTGRQLAAGQTAGQRLMQQQIDQLLSRVSPLNRGLLDQYSRGLLTSYAVTD